jgi:hypothetical protein
MQAFTGKELERFQVNTLTGVVKLAPNLNVVVQNALSQHIMIRGVGTNEFFGNAPSSVGTYMDDVTMNSSYTSTLGLFDMERVEVCAAPEHAVRPQYHRRRRELHHQAASASAGRRRLCHRDPQQPQPGDLEPPTLHPLHHRPRVRQVPLDRWNDFTWGAARRSAGFSARRELDPLDEDDRQRSVHLARDDSQAQPQASARCPRRPAGLDFDEQTIFGNLGSDISFNRPCPSSPPRTRCPPRTGPTSGPEARGSGRSM